MYFFLFFAVGLGLLIGGLLVMRSGLRHVFSPALAGLLGRLTVTPWRGLLAGAAGAALMQSSTALTLTTVGLVSAEYLSFRQGLGLVLGANIGTCSTVGLLALDPPLPVLLALLAASLLAAALSRLRAAALAVGGLAAMLTGVQLLSGALSGLSEAATVVRWLASAGQNPLAGIGGGILLTFLFQSSSAATGLLMALADEGTIGLTAAAYGVYGNNIGSCLSSLVVGAAAPLAAKRVAMAHIVLNLAGVTVFLPFTALFVQAAALLADGFAARVAAMHTLFNIVSSLAVLPFAGAFASLVALLVPGRDGGA
ncbi:MAG: Na/Pi symporter [Sporomusaceae bacterium]|nr:Na/Pi symporter [Sporomusaceae bacterium]